MKRKQLYGTLSSEQEYHALVLQDVTKQALASILIANVSRGKYMHKFCNIPATVVLLLDSPHAAVP